MRKIYKPQNYLKFMKLYHGTLEENVESINRNGITLNRSKSQRPDKSFTDVFNHVFNEKSGLYLPANMQNLSIDRNSAIFLSALPDEFRKSQHLSAYREHQGKKDAQFEVEITGELPVFDSEDFSSWTGKFKNILNTSKIVERYMSLCGNDEIKERQMFHSLMGYFMDGKAQRLSQYGLNEEEINTFCKLRETILDFASQGVKQYCDNSLLLSEFANQFNYMKNYNGSISWFGEHKSKFKRIGELEILCNYDIHKDKIKLI